MLTCPACSGQNVFIERRAICRDCGTSFDHALADCPPAAELVALIAEQVAKGTPADKLKDYVFWTEATGLAIAVTPPERYRKLYNMLTAARFGIYTPQND